MMIAFSVYLLLLKALCVHLPVKAYIPSGYLGCYKDTPDTRILHEKSEATAKNSGDRCKTFCKSANYRYAGTEFSTECFCGNQIRTEILSDGCNKTCAGNKEEYCGGSLHISIYDTWMCATKPCEHGGECEDITAYNFSCKCTGQWTGKTCELNDENKSLLVVYILLPLSAMIVVGLVIIAICLKQRKRKDTEDAENIIRGTEFGPHLYENSATADHESGDKTFNGSLENQLGDTEQQRIGSVADTYNEIYSDSVMTDSSEYNVLSLHKANVTRPGLVYDHIEMQTNPTSDSCYSNLLDTKTNVAQTVPFSTYSHIRDIEANTITADTTYNRLENVVPKARNSRMNKVIFEDKQYDQLRQTQNLEESSLDNSNVSPSKKKLTSCKQLNIEIHCLDEVNEYSIID